jgi:hypothetical protein
MKKTLKPGGRLDLFLDFYAENKPSHVWAQTMGLDLSLFSAENWTKICLEAGFSKASHQFTRDPAEAISEATKNIWSFETMELCG